MDVKQFLENKKIDNINEDRKKILSAVTGKLSSLAKYLDAQYYEEFNYNLADNISWTNKNYKLLESLFGKLAPYIKKGWEIKQDYILKKPILF